MQINIRKIIYLNCGERYEDMIDHRSYAHTQIMNGIRTHDLWDTGAVLYRLSYQAIWELVTL